MSMYLDDRSFSKLALVWRLTNFFFFTDSTFQQKNGSRYEIFSYLSTGAQCKVENMQRYGLRLVLGRCDLLEIFWVVRTERNTRVFDDV